MAKIFVKVSGDLFDQAPFLSALESVIIPGSEATICVGGGTQINEALVKAGFLINMNGPLGREPSNVQERKIALKVLRNNKNTLRRILQRHEISATVIVPVVKIGTTECHVNGDQMALTAYHGFDQLFVFTLMKRTKDKINFFKPYQKIRVIGV